MTVGESVTLTAEVKGTGANSATIEWAYGPAWIFDVALVDVDVTGKENVGGLIGYNIGEVTNASSEGSVAGEGAVGGLIGRSSIRNVISESSSSGQVTGTQGTIGGLVGYNNGGTIEQSLGRRLGWSELELGLHCQLLQLQSGDRHW